MAVFDAHKNFSSSLVAVAPSPASTGVNLTVTTSEGNLFPAPPFNVTIWPNSSNPNTTNAEIARVTAIAGDVLTITRAQESTANRTVIVGDQIALTVTTKMFTDIETQITATNTLLGTAPAGAFPNVASRVNNIEFPSITTVSSTTLTLALSNASDILTFTSVSPVTVSVPLAANVPFTIGTSILLRQAAAGQVGIVPVSGVTLNSRGSLTHLAGQFAWATLIKVATDTWDLMGDLA